jgi:hypothetical protein
MNYSATLLFFCYSAILFLHPLRVKVSVFSSGVFCKNMSFFVCIVWVSGRVHFYCGSINLTLCSFSYRSDTFLSCIYHYVTVLLLTIGERTTGNRGFHGEHGFHFAPSHGEPTIRTHTVRVLLVERAGAAWLAVLHISVRQRRRKHGGVQQPCCHCNTQRERLISIVLLLEHIIGD